MLTSRKVLEMGQVDAQDARDVAIYRAWVDGHHQDDLADQYGVQQPAISKAIARVQEVLPAPEKESEIRRAARLCDDMLSRYVPGARELKPAHSREARGWLQLKAKWLGIDRKEIQVHGEFTHTFEPGPTVEEILERWRAEGKLKLRGEITRLDGA
jgi:hypothetical protein